MSKTEKPLNFSTEINQELQNLKEIYLHNIESSSSGKFNEMKIRFADDFGLKRVLEEFLKYEKELFAYLKERERVESLFRVFVESKFYLECEI